MLFVANVHKSRPRCFLSLFLFCQGLSAVERMRFNANKSLPPAVPIVLTYQYDHYHHRQVEPSPSGTTVPSIPIQCSMDDDPITTNRVSELKGVRPNRERAS
mmetsp:Transcript_24630/g.37645  ORF Transcript_24630/g.37645 Transcript_24630/m.37645 type:complete len:102 (-) Transcript_24630:523-828(-)